MFDTRRFIAGDGPIPVSADPPETIPEEYVAAVASLRLHRPEHLSETLGDYINVRRLKIGTGIKELPSWIRGLKHLRRLEVESYDLTDLPDWLSELTNLREIWLSRCGELERIPPVVWELPRLESLKLFYTTFDHLDGIEQSKSLRSVVVHSDALVPKLDSIGKTLSEQTGLEVDVVPCIASTDLTICRDTDLRVPKKKTQLTELLVSAPTKSALSGLDLSGLEFENLDFEFDLSNANLSACTFKNCFFHHTKLTGANLSGARFERCYFEMNCDMESMEAPNVVFEECHIAAAMDGSNFQGATISTSPGSRVYLEGSDLRNANVKAFVTKPGDGDNVELISADLRDATVWIGLDPASFERISASKAKARWKKADTEDAKTNAATEITYQALKQKKTKAKKGAKVAKPVATLCGANASCWFIAADAQVALGWTGSKVDDNWNELPGTDFERALEQQDGPIEIGDQHGLVGHVGGCGCSKLWSYEDAFYFLEAYEGEDVDFGSKEGIEVLGKLIVDLPTISAETIGTFTVSSGAMTFMLPYVASPFSSKEVTAAVKKGKVLEVEHDCDALLLPVANGEYQIIDESLDYDESIGMLDRRIKICRVS